MFDKLTDKEIEFVDYCYEFYGENAKDVLYPMIGVDKGAIIMAMKLLPVLIAHCPVEYDSIHREHVRNILHYVAGYEFKENVAA